MKDIKVDAVKGEGVKGEGVKQEGQICGLWEDFNNDIRTWIRWIESGDF